MSSLCFLGNLLQITNTAKDLDSADAQPSLALVGIQKANNPKLRRTLVFEVPHPGRTISIRPNQQSAFGGISF